MSELAATFPLFPITASGKSRPLRALINLDAFLHNLKLIQQQAATAEVLVVVKADAYGHGLVPLAKAAGDHALAVAIPEELAELRAAGLKNRVWVLEGPFDLECLSLSENVVWVLHSLWQLDLLVKAFKAQRFQTLSVCLKLDTGMHRLGFSESELERVFEFLAEYDCFQLESVMTHFAQSDEPDNAHVIAQMSKFDSLLKQYEWISVKQSMANSGAILYYPGSHRNWVRPGIMLYGARPSPTTPCALSIKPVMQFQSAIIALHNVKKGDSVGYGAAWTADKDSLIATVAVGYADGYPRHAPSGTPVGVLSSVTGEIHRVSLVGRVSMDMITIDVSAIARVKVGDVVELWGATIPADEVALKAETIAYELFTGVSKRVPRVYQS